MPERLKVLRADDGPVLLAVDFGEGRRTAAFPELAAALPGPATVVECLASVVDELSDEDAGARSYARLVLDDVAAAGYEVAAVLGRCGGAGLACGLAEELARTGGHRPPAVVLDAEEVDGGFAHFHFERVVRVLAPALDPGVVAAALRDSRTALDRHRGDLAELLRGMAELYADLAPVATAAFGVPGTFAEDLVRRYEAFLRYLLCASRTRISLPYDGLHRVVSRDYRPRAGEVGRPVHRCVTADGVELLASAEVAELLTRLLAGQSPNRGA